MKQPAEDTPRPVHAVPAWLPRGDDRGVDATWRAPDGTVWEVRCKRFSRFVRTEPDDDALPVECPRCAGDRSADERAASNLTAAASGTYFLLWHSDDDLPRVELPRPVVTLDTHLVMRLLVPPAPPGARSMTAAELKTSAEATGHEVDGGLAAIAEVTETLQRLLRHWKNLARTQHHLSRSAPQRRRLDLGEHQRAVGAAGCAVRAAYVARDAVVRDHPSVAREAVARFVVDWLGLRPTDEMVEAAGNALLQAPLRRHRPRRRPRGGATS